MRAAVAASLLLVAGLPGLAPGLAQDRAASYRFRLERTGLTVPVWSLQVNADGSAVYWEGVTATPAESPESGAQPARRFHISSATLEKIAAAAPVVAGGRCETKLKHIAQTGAKTISVAKEPPASCTFNYSDDDRLNAAAAAFQAVAETQQSGERLEHAQRFDRLGLDAELDLLIGALKDGRASDPRTIQPILERLAGDERVMDRVRRKASHLLDLSTPTP